MNGKNHIATGIATMGLCSSMSAFSEHYEGIGKITFRRAMGTFDNMMCVPVGNLPVMFGVQLGFLLFIFGVLLPDIDSRRSILGKFMYLPIKHRTWTHSIWPPLVFMALGLLWLGFFWLGFGYMVHLVFDSMSRQGICWFYPISGYRYYPGGAAIKHKKRIWLYRTGQKSEHVVALVYLVFCVAFVLFFGLHNMLGW